MSNVKTFDSRRDVWMDRAKEAFEAMHQWFFLPAEVRYRENLTPSEKQPYASLWPYGQALASANLLASLGDEKAGNLCELLVQAFERDYWSERPPAGATSQVGGGDRFYDDNLWIGLEMVRIYHRTGDVSKLRLARRIFDFAISGWDDDPSHPAPGGIFWVESPTNRDRNTVTNGPAAQMGLRLYAITGERRFFEWACRTYGWARKYLQSSTGLYWDHIDLQGNIERTHWSYNQGNMIAPAVLLYKTEKNPAFLKDAETLLTSALDYFQKEDRLFLTQLPAFNAIFFRNALLVDAERVQPLLWEVVNEYAERLWHSNRDPNTGLYAFPQTKGDFCEPSLLNQAAVVQVFALMVRGRP